MCYDKSMFRKWFNYILSGIGSLTIMILGIVFFFKAEIIMPFLWFLINIILIVLLVIRFIMIITRKDSLKKNLLYIGIYALILGLMVAYPTKYIEFIGLTVGLYAIINAIISFIDYYIGRKDHLNGIFSKLLMSVIYLIFGLLLIFIPLRSTALIFVLSGIYLVIFGLFNLISQTMEHFNHHFNITIALPVLISAIIPARVFLKISQDSDLLKTLDDNPDDDEEYPLEIFIYVQEKGFESFGHCDISFKGEIYSYGLHDPKARMLFGSAGDGVLVKAKRNPFLRNCLKSGKTMIFCFRLKPHDDEMKLIEERIKELMKDTVPFDCDARIEEKMGQQMMADDYISDVYKDTGCELYKFKRGKFKTYFVFTTNCVGISDYLIRNKEIDLLNMSGIVSPGTYLNFLYQLFLKPDSIIKELKVYKKAPID